MFKLISKMTISLEGLLVGKLAKAYNTLAA